MSISPIMLQQNIYQTNFCSAKKSQSRQSQSQDNPISRKGEAANLTKATFIGGLALAGRLLWEVIIDGDFAIDEVANKASKIVDKNKKNLNPEKRFLCKIGAFAGLLAAGFAGFALLYTAFKAPEIKYKSKVNTFTKSQEMDVYTKANAAERDIYTELADKAENATPEEKAKLKEQYAKMAIAKNQVPDFVKINNK